MQKSEYKFWHNYTRSHNSILHGGYNFIKIKSFTFLFLVLLLSWLIKFSKLQSNTQKFNYSWKCTQISDKNVKYVGQSTQDIEIHSQYIFISPSDTVWFLKSCKQGKDFFTLTQAWPKLCCSHHFYSILLTIFLSFWKPYGSFTLSYHLWKLDVTRNHLCSMGR